MSSTGTPSSSKRSAYPRSPWWQPAITISTRPEYDPRLLCYNCRRLIHLKAGQNIENPLEEDKCIFQASTAMACGLSRET